MVANWDYTKFDPLRTAGEYQQGFQSASDAYNNWQSQFGNMYNDPNASRTNTWGAQAVQGNRGLAGFDYGDGPARMGSPVGSPGDAISSPRGGGSFMGAEFGGGQASMPGGYNFDTLPSYGAQSSAGLRAPSMGFAGVDPGSPPPMPDEAAYQANLARLQGNQQLQQGNYNQMMGGGFAGGVLPRDMAQTYQSGGSFGADSRGVRPTNPFAQSPSYGAQQASAASYGRQGGLGGLGGFGGNDPFTVQNPYA